MSPGRKGTRSVETLKKRVQKAKNAVASAAKAAELAGQELPIGEIGIEFDGAVPSIRQDDGRPSIPIVPELRTAPDAPSFNPVDAAEIKGWNRTLPGGSRLEIRKILDVGREQYIDSFSYSEVQKESTPEAFIKRYVTPQVGGGRFALYLIYPNGKRESRGEVDVYEESKPLASSQKQDSMKEILQVLATEREKLGAEVQRREEEARRREESAIQQSIRTMQDAQNRQMELITQQLGAKKEGSGDSSSSSSMMMMLMMMMQNMQADSQRAIAEITRSVESKRHESQANPELHRIDLLTKAVLDKLNKLDDDPPPRRRSRYDRFDMDDLGGLDTFFPTTPNVPSTPEKSISEIIAETASAIGAQLRPKEEEPLLDKVVKYMPLVQPLIDRFLASNEQEKTSLRQKLERMEERLENERRKDEERGSGSDLENVINGISFLRENEALLFPKKPELPMPDSKKESFLDVISNMLPQAIGMLQNFQVPNRGGTNALPSPSVQPTVSISDLVRRMGDMSEEEIVVQLHGLLQLIPSVPGLGQKAVAALTGNPEKDTIVVVGLVHQLLSALVGKKQLTEPAADHILGVVQKHGASLVGSLQK